MKSRPPQLRAMAVALGLVASMGCSKSAEQAPASARRVQVASVKAGEIARQVRLPGTVRAYQEATLYAKVPGYLQSIAVDEGDTVSAGAVLAVIEAPELAADLDKQRAESEISRVEYERLRAAQATAPDLVMPQAVDAAKARADGARAALRRTTTLLGYAKLEAPFAGVVTRRWVDPGAFIPAATSSSSPNSSAVLTLMDFRRVRISLAIPESEISHVSVGVPAQGAARELAGRTFEGAITRFAYALDDATRTMMAEVEIENPDLALRPGMLVDVSLGVEHKPTAILLPAEALVSEKGRHFVYTVADATAHKVPVEIGIDDGVSLEVLSGVSAGAAVVVSGRDGLSDGEAVLAGAAP